MANKVRFPFGVVTSEELSGTGTQAVTIQDFVTILDGVTNPASGNRTINLTIDDQLSAGATLFLKSKTDSTETTIFGDNITAPTITGVSGKTKTQGFMYDGSTFKPLGTNVQID